MHTTAGSSGGLTLMSAPIGLEEVAYALFEGMAEGRFLILPHPEVADHARARLADDEAWLREINGFQRAREA